MGRKLTYWERSQRDDRIEKERALSRELTATRREHERELKELILKQRIKSSSEKVHQWESLYSCIVNLHQLALKENEFYEVGDISVEEIQKFPLFRLFNQLNTNLSFSIPEITRKAKIIYHKRFDVDSYSGSSYLKFLQEEVSISLKEYCRRNNFIFFPLITKLNGCEKAYKEFILQIKDKLFIESEEEVRNNELYFKIYEKYDKLFTQELKAFENQILINEKHVLEEANKQVSILKAHKDKVVQKLTSLDKQVRITNSPIFYQYLFELLYNPFDLTPKEYLLSNPDDIEYGIVVNANESNVLEFIISLPENNFPLKNEQYVLLKEGYSKRPLTNAQKNEINTEYYPALIINKAYSIFRVTNLEVLKVFLTEVRPNELTGKDENALILAYQITREQLSQIKLDKVKASNAIKNFIQLSLNDISNYGNVIWGALDNHKSYSEEFYEILYKQTDLILDDKFTGEKEFSMGKSDKLIEYEKELESIVSRWSKVAPKNIPIEILFRGSVFKTNYTDSDETFAWTSNFSNSVSYYLVKNALSDEVKQGIKLYENFSSLFERIFKKPKFENGSLKKISQKYLQGVKSYECSLHIVQNEITYDGKFILFPVAESNIILIFGCISNNISIDEDEFTSFIQTFKFKQVQSEKYDQGRYVSKIHHENPEVGKAFSQIDDVLVQNSLSLRNTLKKHGLDTSGVDNVLDKYYDIK